jgi:hypothetical protein
MEKDLDYYLNLDWTLIHGTDLDFNGNNYHYIEIKELPDFAFCGPSQEKCLEHYKRKLKLHLMVALESEDRIYEPGEEREDEYIEEDEDW